MAYSLLQINVTANWGANGRIAEEIGKVAMRLGWNSYIAYGRYMNPSNSKLIKIGNKWDVYTHYVEQRIFDNEGLCSSRATRNLIKKIQEIKPDLIQLHDIHDHYLNYHLLFDYLNAANIPVVWTFHDCWAITGHCFHFVTKDCYHWKTGCYECPLRHSYPNTLLDNSRKNWNLKKKLFHDCKNLTIVACSDWIAQFVKESFLKDKRMEVIHNGIDLHVFQPKLGDRHTNGKFKVLTVSNVWLESKGYYDLFKLRYKLPKEYELVIVGVSASQQKKLPEGIVGIRRTQNVDELVSLYSSANVLINPTYADTFPTVNLEALACGTPVVTYRTGGSPEAIDDNTGIIVEQGDIEAMASAIKSICKKGKTAYTDACRQRAVDHFNKDDRFQDYIHLYEEILSNKANNKS